MSKEIVLSSSESKGFSEALEFAKKWCSENQWAVGVGEMAVGAGLIAWAVHNGIIEMGTQLVATELGGTNVESIIGAVGGTGIGAIAGSIVGSIGVTGMGGAIGIPAVLVLSGAAAVLGMAGYTAGDVAHNVTANAVDINALVENGSVLLVGVALIIDGARRCIKDQKVLSALSLFKDKVVILNDLSSKIVAKSMEELEGFIEELMKLPEDNIEASIGTGSAALGAGIGASAGGAVAAGSVTVLGSQALGGAVVSLGLVSAPVWPVVAGIAGGTAIGYAAYKAVKYWYSKPYSASS
jgi:hypothetical protein